MAITKQKIFSSSLSIKPHITNNIQNTLKLKGSIFSNISSRVITKIPFATPINGRNNGIKLNLGADKFDASELTIKNGEFQPAGGVGGITVLRPEILSLFNFYPIYNNKIGNRTLNSYGKFIEINFQSSYLHRDSVVQLVSNIENALSADTAAQSVKDNFDSINKSFSQPNLDNIANILKYESGILDVLHTIEDNFDIKNIGETPFTINNSLSIPQLYIQRMGYNKEQFDRFTNSKIYNQIILDLKAIIENYSFGLLDIVDKDRKKDFDPINLDTTYSTTDDNFTFKISQLGGQTKSVDAISLKTFDSFQNSLPHEPTNKLRIILTLLSKEFRISKALGKKEVSNQLNDYFGANNIGNPFDNIFGIPSSNILKRPSGGTNSLAKLSFIDVDPNLQLNKNYNKDMFVLPFEKKYIDSTIEKSSTYIPGSSYFIDSILHTNKINLNLSPINSYTDTFTTTTKNVQEIVGSLLDLKNRETNLLPDKFYQQFISTTKKAFYTSNTFDNQTRVSQGGKSITTDETAGVILMSLAKLSQKDKTLNHLLFQYYVISGINNNKTTNITGNELWDGISIELSDIRNMPYFRDNLDATFEIKNPNLVVSFDLKNKGPTSSLTWAMEMLAKSIEQRVAKIMLKKDNLSDAPFVFVDVGTVNPPPPTIQPKQYIVDLNKLFPNVELHSLDVTKGVISQQLAISANVNGMVKSFSDFMIWIGSESKTDNSFFISDGSFRTRYNLLSPSSVMLMSYELFNSFINKYLFAEFVSVEKGTGLISIWDKKTNSAIFSVIDDIANLHSTGTNSYDKTLIVTNIDKPSTKTKSFSDSIQNNDLVGKITIKSPSPVGVETKSSNKGKKRFSSKFIDSETEIKNANLSFIQTSGDTVSYIKKNTFLALDTDKNTIKLIDELHRNQERLLEEDHTIFCMLNAFTVIASKIKDANTLAKNNFSDTKINEALLNLSFSRKKNADGSEVKNTNPESFNYPYTIEQLKRITDIQQVQLSWNTYNSFQERFVNKYDNTIGNEEKTFVAIDIVHKDVKNTLYAYLAASDLSEQQEASTRMKILSVGIPAGFKSNIVDKFLLSTKTRSKKDLLTDKQLDLIKINVYKRETRYSDIVFKPQTFIFDMSMFQLQSGIIAAKPEITDNFDKIIQKIVLQNYELNNGTITPFKVSLTENSLLNSFSIDNMESYNMISKDQKRELITNHVVSYLLESYMKLLSGIKMNEETFTIDDNNNLDLYGPNGPDESLFESTFKDLLKSYLKDVLKENIPNGTGLWYLTKRDDVSDNVKDIIRTMTFGNELFVPGFVRSKVLNPKTFERVFNLPINIDKFEVDIDETNKTSSGKASLSQAKTQNLLYEIGTDTKITYFNKRDKNDIILEDLFITIENMA